MATKTSLIRLAESDFEDLGFEDESDPTGSMGDDGSGDDEMYDDMAGDDSMNEAAYKGKRVHGPRTKLDAAMDGRISRIENSIANLAKAVNAVASVQKAILEKGYEEFEDEVDPEEDEFGGEEKGIVNMARTNKSGQSAAAGSKVSKDDAASSFGEKDSDAPGNRPYDMKDNGGDDATVIQGGPGAGPGPVSKADVTITPKQLVSLIKRSVREEMATLNSSTIHKAESPAVGASSSQLNKGDEPSEEEIFKIMKGKSFSEINRARLEIGGESALG